MPEAVLTILKFVLLALLYLFFLRVLSAVWAEVHARPITGREAQAAVAGRPSVRRPKRGAGSQGATRLKVIEPAKERGRVYDLGDELTIGRSSGCQIALAEDKLVSQIHARIFRKDAQHFVEDLGSTNGTYLNRTRVTSAVPLRRGDRLAIGKHVLEVTR